MDSISKIFKRGLYTCIGRTNYKLKFLIISFKKLLSSYMENTLNDEKVSTMSISRLEMAQHAKQFIFLMSWPGFSQKPKSRHCPFKKIPPSWWSLIFSVHFSLMKWNCAKFTCHSSLSVWFFRITGCFLYAFSESKLPRWRVTE